MKSGLIALLLFVSLSSFGQDTTKVEQYCKVVASDRLLSNKVTISIDYGEERSIWKDNRLKADNGKVKTFNTIIDAINYLGKDGWKLVNAFPVTSGTSSTVYHYVFKKEFSKSQLE